MKPRVSIALACVALALVAAPRLLSATATATDTAPTATSPSADSPSAASPSTPPAAHDGIWIWTRTDAEVYAARGPEAAAAIPGVLVLSLELDASAELRGRRGLSPAIRGAKEVAAVIRIEDSVARRLDDPGALAAELDARLGSMLAEIDASGMALAEVQLDFDVPVRRLEAWAEVAGTLARGSLAGRPLWVTSIPAHLADDRYGALFSGQVAGHLYQTFDTGLACNPREIAKAREQLVRAGLPYRVGVATYERARDGRRTTGHRCWAQASPELRHAGLHAGSWVFPAGRPVDDAFALFEDHP